MKILQSKILKSDLTCDINGGDSFSDIYGMKRLVMGYLIKRICQISGNLFVLLPQTYGPFKSVTAKNIAKKILHQAYRIYSRDKESLDVINGLIGNTEQSRVCPDLAFTLEKAAIEKVAQKCNKAKYLIDKINDLKEKKYRIIGLNISGLLYSGGYTGKNELGIRDNYKILLNKIIELFLSQDDTFVVMVPHVVPEDLEVEDDLIACRRAWGTLNEKLKKRTLISETNEDQLFYNQCEIKTIIGLCDFFLGSRIHSTIASISQCIPTVGLAYSKKFVGVYETAGVDDCVVDLRKNKNEEIIDTIKNIYNNKDIIKEKLENRIPEIQRQVYSIFDDL